MPDRPIHANLIMIAAATTPADRKRIFGRRRIGLDFQFQLPGDELAQSGVERDGPRRGASKNPLVLNKACLKTTDLLAPGGEALLLLFCCWLPRFLRHRLLVVLARGGCGKPEAIDAASEA